ncbi:nucleotidyltransferase domain-containing protein [Methylobacter sp.]|uniref:nucleotidyltransferase domain-containing protein n=1 Tax=Methylobacter sp. TaxID=2051955 RepID=UPI002FDCF7CA
MTQYGLNSKQIVLLKQIFAHYPEIETVKLYGSRAKGTHHAQSDIDLAAFGRDLNRFLIADVLMALADSDLPYTVDLQDYQSLKNRQLLEYIDRVGVVIYSKEGGIELANDRA